MIILLSGMVFLGLLLFFSSASRAPTELSAPADRLLKIRAHTARPRDLDAEALVPPLRERVVRPALRTLAQVIKDRLPTLRLSSVERRLDVAGIHEGFFKDPETVIGLSMITGLIGGLLTSYFLLTGDLITSIGPRWLGIFGLAPGTYAGLFIPGMYLSMRAGGRRRRMAEDLPDFLDLLTICLAAGDTFDAALLRTCTQSRGPLAEEFRIVYLKVASLGKDRREVWLETKDMLRVDAISQFISAYVQAESSGGSVVKILNEQAALLRTRRLQAAEAAGATAQYKMMPAIILFFLPALMIMVLGPMMAPMMSGLLGGGP